MLSQIGLSDLNISSMVKQGMLFSKWITLCIYFQLTYSMSRFAIYETVKNNLQQPGQQMPFYQKVLLGGVSGAIGGIAGTPGDLINVR